MLQPAVSYVRFVIRKKKKKNSCKYIECNLKKYQMRLIYDNSLLISKKKKIVILQDYSLVLNLRISATLLLECFRKLHIRFRLLQ